MVALNSKFDILRGWPNSSAVQEDFVIGGTATHAHKQGMWVILNTSNKDGSMVTADSLPTSTVAIRPSIIIEGRDDYSSRFANRVTCLLGGGYVVRIPQKGVDAEGGLYNCLAAAASTYAPGQLLEVTNGVLSAIDANEEVNAVGRVLAVDSNANTIDFLVI
jgi:hypothetical protein